MFALLAMFSTPSASSACSLSFFSQTLHFRSPLASPFTPKLSTWFSLVRFASIAQRAQIPRIVLLRCNTLTTINDHNATSKLLGTSETMLFSLFEEIGFSESETESLLDSNAALKFMPLESLRARIRSLQSLGVIGGALSRLITKRPEVLTGEEVEALLSFLLDTNDLGLKGKIEPEQIQSLLNATQPKFLAGFEEKLRLLLDQGIPRENLVYVLNNVNLSKALCQKSCEEIERVFAFLNGFGGVDLILRRPAILNYDLDAQLAPRIGFLFELSSRDESATATVLRKLPPILAYSVDHLKDHVDFLKSFAGLSEQEIFKIVRVYPNLFSASRERKLHPRIDFLKQCGLDSNDIYRFLMKAPLFVSLSLDENLLYKLVFLVKIGYENRTRELAMAMGSATRTSSINMQEVIGVLLRYGLTFEDILEMSKKHPQVLQYNHKSLEKKLNYLIEEMGRDVGELLGFPAFLGYKLDGRIKRRFEEKRKLLGDGMSLNKLLSVSAARFAMKSKRKRTKI